MQHFEENKEINMFVFCAELTFIELCTHKQFFPETLRLERSVTPAAPAHQTRRPPAAGTLPVRSPLSDPTCLSHTSFSSQ